VVRNLETADKLIVEENYLPERIFNMDQTSLFWKQMSERSFIHKGAKSKPGFRVGVFRAVKGFIILEISLAM
jgi:hypothetical protein